MKGIYTDGKRRFSVGFDMSSAVYRGTWRERGENRECCSSSCCMVCEVHACQIYANRKGAWKIGAEQSINIYIDRLVRLYIHSPQKLYSGPLM